MRPAAPEFVDLSGAASSLHLPYPRPLHSEWQPYGAPAYLMASTNRCWNKTMSYLYWCPQLYRAFPIHTLAPADLRFARVVGGVTAAFYVGLFCLSLVGAF